LVSNRSKGARLQSKGAIITTALQQKHSSVQQ